MGPQQQNTESELEKAQLLKLQLEILSLESQRQEQTTTADLRQQKLKQELSSQKWQNSRIGRLAQFGAIITVIVAVVGLLITYLKFTDERSKDRELREKELVERNTNQYRADIQQLVQFTNDEKQTTPSLIFLFQDLREIVESTKDPTELSKRRESVANLIVNLIKSTGFDLQKSRNVEFDFKAMSYCEYYSNLLRNEPDINLDILSKYKDALVSLASNNQGCYKSVVIRSDGYIFGDNCSSEGIRLDQFIDSFYAYQKHVEVLKESVKGKPQDASTKDSLQRAFCWFYQSTKNKALAKNIFDGDEKQCD
jgi:hypothetical protein